MGVQYKNIKKKNWKSEILFSTAQQILNLLVLAACEQTGLSSRPAVSCIGMQWRHDLCISVWLWLASTVNNLKLLEMGKQRIQALCHFRLSSSAWPSTEDIEPLKKKGFYETSAVLCKSDSSWVRTSGMEGLVTPSSPVKIVWSTTPMQHWKW